MALNETQKAALATWLADQIGAASVRIRGCERLNGGAIQENLAVEIEVSGGSRAGRHSLVLRADAPSGVPESRTRVEEFAILRLVHDAGLRVPLPWTVEPTGRLLGRPFVLMARAAGEARGARLVRDPEIARNGDAIIATLASELAKLHRIDPAACAGLPGFAAPGEPLLAIRIAELRRGLDALAEPQPVLEWGLRWLERHGSPGGLPCLVHADLRTGNFLVDAGEVTAILDWEFARLSDPLEDLGWLLARCWRFGRLERHAGGIGSRAALLDAYAAAMGVGVDGRAVQHWELFATIRWGLIALQQAARHFSGAEPSLELALTAHVVPVLERDVLAYVEAIEEERTI